MALDGVVTIWPSTRTHSHRDKVCSNIDLPQISSSKTLPQNNVRSEFWTSIFCKPNLLRSCVWCLAYVQFCMHRLHCRALVHHKKRKNTTVDPRTNSPDATKRPGENCASFIADKRRSCGFSSVTQPPECKKCHVMFCMAAVDDCCLLNAQMDSVWALDIVVELRIA